MSRNKEEWCLRSQCRKCSENVDCATVPSTADTANEMKILNIHFVNVKVTVDLDKGSCHGVVGMKV